MVIRLENVGMDMYNTLRLLQGCDKSDRLRNLLDTRSTPVCYSDLLRIHFEVIGEPPHCHNFQFSLAATSTSAIHMISGGCSRKFSRYMHYVHGC